MRLFPTGLFTVLTVVSCEPGRTPLGPESRTGHGTQPRSAPTVDYPHPQVIAQADCGELVALLVQVRDADVARMRALDDLVSLEGEGLGGTPQVRGPRRQAEMRVFDRYRELGCQWASATAPPSELAVHPDFDPANPAQEFYAEVGDTADLEVALRALIVAMDDYRDRFGRFPHDMQELRSSTDLGTPTRWELSVVSSTVDTACIEVDSDEAPFPIYLRVPVQELTIESC